jgi:hypothetical protein
VRLVGLGDATLRTAAFATTLGTSLALAMSALALRRQLGVSLPLATALRTSGSAALAFYVAKLIPQTNRLMAPVVMLAAGMVYLAGLVLTRELTRSDADAVLKLARRRRG